MELGSLKERRKNRAELLRRAQEGDKEAFQTLFEDIGPLLTRFVRHRIFDPAEVEDVCQETLLAIYKSRHTYEPSQPFEPWLFAIGRHVIGAYLRRHRSRATVREPIGDMDEAVAEDDVGLALEFHEALGQLSQIEMEAIKLIKVEGLSLAEAARRTGVHTGALKVRVHRAYARLKNSILR